MTAPAYDEVWSLTSTGPVLGEHRGAQVFSRVHNRAVCQPYPCWLHAPSDHHMKDWPTVYRSDKALCERTCAHGIGHPDPDDCDYHEREGRMWVGVHGCDGCCRKPGAGL